MSEEMKKYLAIGFVVVCLGIAGYMVKKTFWPSNNFVDAPKEVALLCKTCGGFEVPVEEFRTMMSQVPMDMMMESLDRPMALKCPKCSNKSCYVAQKCPSCSNIFIYGQAKDKNVPDRCPKCGKSRMEELQKSK